MSGMAGAVRIRLGAWSRSRGSELRARRSVASCIWGAVCSTGVLVSAFGMVVMASCARPPAPGERIPGGREMAGIGDTPGRFVYPRCLEAGASGLWVIDRSARVQRLDPLTGRCTGFFKMPEYELGKPTGFLAGPGAGKGGEWTDELLYIADTHYHRIMVYQPPGPVGPDAKSSVIDPTLVTSFGTFGRGPGEFVYPTDVAVVYGEDGKSVERVFVSEYGGNDRVSLFDGRFQYVRSFGTFGLPVESGGAITFNRPQSMGIDWSIDGGALVVGDSCNHRLGVFTLEGELVRWIGEKAIRSAAKGSEPAMPSTMDLPRETSVGAVDKVKVGEPAKFLYPYGVRVLGDGTVLVSEFGAARVQRVDLTSGVCLGSWGRAGRGAGELAVPWSVTTIGRSVYVLDSGNNRVQVFEGPDVKVRARRTGQTHAANSPGGSLTP